MLAAFRSRAISIPLRLPIRWSQRQVSSFQTPNHVSPQTTLKARSFSSLNATSLPPWRSFLIRRTRGIRNNSQQAPKPAQEQATQKKPEGLSARFKDLSRRYGWSAVGVYFFLSALDFPFCFLAVRWLGTDRIAYAEHLVAEAFWGVLGAVGLDFRSKDPEYEPATGTAAGIRAGRSIAQETGVDAKHNGASMCRKRTLCPQGRLADVGNRHLDAAASRLRRAQVTHLLQGPAHGSSDTANREVFARSWLECRETEKDRLNDSKSQCKRRTVTLYNTEGATGRHLQYTNRLASGSCKTTPSTMTAAYAP